jgi:hypothetical protein
VAVISLIVGLITFRSTSAAQTKAADAQTQASAVGLLQEYYAVALQNPEVSRIYDLSNDQYVGWFAPFAMFTAESIYNLTKGEEGWESTVSHIVNDHMGYVLTKGLGRCASYTEDFIKLTQNLADDVIRKGQAEERVEALNPSGMPVPIPAKICE